MLHKNKACSSAFSLCYRCDFNSPVLEGPDAFCGWYNYYRGFDASFAKDSVRIPWEKKNGDGKLSDSSLRGRSGNGMKAKHFVYLLCVKTLLAIEVSFQIAL